MDYVRLFFQTCWNELKDTISPTIKDFFLNCSSLRHLNHTNIALIPKVDHKLFLIINLLDYAMLAIRLLQR